MNSINVEASYKLSPMQQGMLFHHQLEPGSGVNIDQMVCSLHEDLDVVAFRKAWESVVSRHRALRTSFQWERIDDPLQHVHSMAKLPFELRDWQNLSGDKQQNDFAEYLKLDRRKGFDLTEAPLMRVALFRVGEADYRAVWTFHHIIADGRSHPIILNDVFAFYEAIREGKKLELEQPKKYQDYIEWFWQRDHSKSETFWKELLGGFTAPTTVDSIPKITLQSEYEEGHGEQEIEIAESIASQLKTVAKEHHLTLSTLVQGSWAFLLSQYAGEDDVVIGVVRACRRETVADADSMVGLFINTLPVRVKIPSDQNLTLCLEEIRKQSRAIRDHEHTPLVQVLGWSDVRHRMPLFESIFIFDNYYLNSKLREKGEKWQNREFRLIEKNGFPLSLYAYDDHRLLLNISFDRNRFDDLVIEQILRNLKTLLEGMAENIDRPPSALPILTEKEKYLLLKEWNDTHKNYPKEACIHQLFEKQVEQTPDDVALVFEDRQLTYRQLDTRANQLAHYLRKLNVGPEILVGIYMERSLEMMVGMLGVLKAGGAYLPLDPGYPPDRVAYMMEDTQAPVVLTQKHLEVRLPANQSKVFCLDSDWDIIAKEKTERLNSGVRSENLAYVIYTSGSTGKPKGAMNEHRGIVNRLLWMQDEYNLTAFDRILQKTPFSFDVSVWEFFWGLLFGARLVMAKPGGHRDSAYLVDTIINEGITTLHFVPSMLHSFLDEERVEKCMGLKRVICSGEALPYALQTKFFNKLGTVELHNLYGPTEAAVDVTYWRCQRDIDLSVVPIGRPVANTQIYILNKWMQPVSIGVPGELHIGGVQVGRGYLNRPELTAEKFVTDPFSSQTGALLYKTGDLCRYLPDGNIEYLSRIDNQIKIHGFRIELGEIETLLEQHSLVRQAVVVAREDVPGDKLLVAYIVPDGDQTPSVSKLRQSLKDKLPEYMVPNTFVMLEKFPLTPSGKTDRRSLPSPTGLRPELESAYVAPQTEIEQTITAIWQEVLQLEKIGVNDNFFDVGGHSFRMAQVHSRLREKLQRDLSMLEMFKYPTISSLARYLSLGKNEQISFEKIDDRVEKLKAGKNRMKQILKQREQVNQ